MPQTFREILPASFVDQASQQANARFNNSVYSPLVVLWLLMWQRLHGAAPLRAAVLDLLQDLPSCWRFRLRISPSGPFFRAPLGRAALRQRLL
jgi:hypothetical protein